MPDLLPWAFGSLIGLLSAGATVHVFDGRLGRAAMCLVSLAAVVIAARMGVAHVA
jgi:hypothetical protein